VNSDVTSEFSACELWGVHSTSVFVSLFFASAVALNTMMAKNTLKMNIKICITN
jgi:hypothetical protein